MFPKPKGLTLVCGRVHSYLLSFLKRRCRLSPDRERTGPLPPPYFPSQNPLLVRSTSSIFRPWFSCHLLHLFLLIPLC